MFASRKRAWDEDEDDLLEPEHESKLAKACSLPFRTSPTTKYLRTALRSPCFKPAALFTQTITPGDSSEEECPPPLDKESRPQPTAQFVLGSTIYTEPNYDLEMDVTDSQPLASPRQWNQQAFMTSPKPSPFTITPPSPRLKDPLENAQSSVFGGRLPTPIYGHFQQSIDGKMGIGADPENIISRSQQEIDYENYVRRRRLPTPISEDESMDESTTSAGEMMGRLGVDSEIYSGQQSHTKVHHSLDAASRGRLSFSMGIRADCEMCRNRIPGHSNHIFRVIT